MEISKCCYCKNDPTLIALPGDLYYVQCSCGKHGLYDYIGSTRNAAIESWNKGNYTKSLYNRGGNKDAIQDEIS